MEQVRLRMIVTILIICCAWLTACKSESADYDNNELRKLEKVLGVKFPADAKVVYSVKNDRNNEIYYNHIVCTQNPVEVLKNALSSRQLGKLKDKYTYTYEGSYKNGEWRAYQTNFESGSYLDVKQFYF